MAKKTQKKAKKKAPKKKAPKKKAPKKKAPKKKAKQASYKADPKWEVVREEAAKRRSDLSVKGRDIAPMPVPGNLPRRNAALKSFRKFCDSYFPSTFHLKWSPDHLKVIKKIQTSTVDGGLFALAMPRGFGKTSLCEIASLWSLVAGYHKFVCLIATDLKAATSMLDSIKVELETNELLLEDFPEICYPIHCLEGIYQRAGGQILDGVNTNIGWTADELILPTVPGSKASAGIIRVAGITGRIRGMKYKRPDGKAVRPSLVVLDDPQSDESARSPQQIQQRIDLLNGAILNLAGPSVKLSGFCPCTVIYPKDMADRILDRQESPSWHGERTKMVYSFPDREDMWEEYADIRNKSLQAGGAGEEATKFYRENRKEMDQGCKVAWKEWVDKDELSAIQHAMNIRYRKGAERAWASEFQNDPLPPAEEMGASKMRPEMVAAKLNGLAKGFISAPITELTAFVDVHGEALYWMVVAWEQNFTGNIVDYGCWPEQPVPYFTLATIPRGMASVVTQTAGLEGRIYKGFELLVPSLLKHEWKGDGDVGRRIGKCLIDANWGKSTDSVYRFCRQSDHSAILVPSHGKFYGAATVPMGEARKKPGEKVGQNWISPVPNSGRGIRHVVFDTNYWKSFLLERFLTSMGDSGSLSIFGRDETPHQLLFDHLAAEYCIRTEGRGRTVDVWEATAVHQDNHWLDCLVGAAVGASMLGIELFQYGPDKKKKPIKLSEIQAQKRAQQRA